MTDQDDGCAAPLHLLELARAPAPAPSRRARWSVRRRSRCRDRGRSPTRSGRAGAGRPRAGRAAAARAVPGAARRPASAARSPALPARRASPTRCSRSASAISAPTGRSGSSETSASCRMKPTSRPRTRRHCRGVKRARVGVVDLEGVGVDDAVASGEPDERARRHALARAGLADDRDALAGSEVERDAPDHLAPRPADQEARRGGSRPSAGWPASRVGIDRVVSRLRDGLRDGHFSPLSRYDCRCRPMVVAASATATITTPGTTIEPARPA